GQILRGEKQATDVLFAGSSFSLVESIFKDNPLADYVNAIVADVLIAYVEERRAQDPQVRLRILEIGAGTGGTSAGILDRLVPLRAHVDEYRYTDVSTEFLESARRTYGAKHSYVTFARFDVEKPFEEQAGAAGQFDVVIAANVLHATRDIRSA